MSDPIPIKPHHFVDIICDLGSGELSFEPSPYGHAVHVVAQKLVEQRDTLLVIELGADAICEPCVHNIDGICDDTIDTSYRPAAPASKREYNLLLDQRWFERLGIAGGDRLSARRLCERVRDRAGDITSIYREERADLTADRARNLGLGIAEFLGQP